MGSARNTLRPVLGGPGRLVNRFFLGLKQLHLRWIYLSEGIHGISRELRTMRRGHDVVLRQFGASVAKDAKVTGPLSIMNAEDDFSNLVIEAGAHVSEEVFFDLTEKVTIGEKTLLGMRTVFVTHFDAADSDVGKRHPRTSGPITIEGGCFIGTGTIVLNGVTVGAGSLVPAGVVIGRDIPPGTDVQR